MAARPAIILGWSILGRDLLEYAAPGLRDILFNRCLRWVGNNGDQNNEQTESKIEED